MRTYRNKYGQYSHTPFIHTNMERSSPVNYLQLSLLLTLFPLRGSEDKHDPHFMALVKPMDLIKSLQKKVCMHSDVYFRTNKQTSKTYTGKICSPSKKAPSAAQIRSRTRFAKVRAAIQTILDDPAQRAVLDKEFKAQTDYGSLLGYTSHKLNGNYDENGDLISN